MYQVNILIKCSTEDVEKFERVIGAVEYATNHFVPRTNVSRLSALLIDGSSILRIDGITTSRRPTKIRRALVTYLQNIGMKSADVSITGIKIKGWEEHAKLLAIVLGFVGIAGIVMSALSWIIHP